MENNVLREEKVVIWDCNKPSVNGRYYKTNEWEREINDPYFLEFLNHGGIPIHFEPKNSMFSDESLCEKLAGCITKVYVKDNKVCGKVKIVDTPYGRIVNELFGKDFLHITPCGYGNIDKFGNVTDMELTCFSFTIYPSEEGYN